MKILKSDKEGKTAQIDAALKKRITVQIMTLSASVLLVLVLFFAMAAAWFTNVAKTSGLVFETESWGFDEEKITLSEEPIQIAPGRSGILPMSIDNRDAKAGEMVQIGVIVSKEAMDKELQKRIFFYVEDLKEVVKDSEEAEIETETGRTYLSSAVSQSYRIFAGQTLTISEIYENDLPINWEWVYDMTGYYFRGTVGESEPTIEEYLRPIEYDYSKAVYEGEEGAAQLPTKIDEKTTAEFLREVSAKDGYEGTIDPENEQYEKTIRVINGVPYYPVEIDEAGHGVWAYLCTKAEVLEGVAYDTELAKTEEGAEAVTAEAKIVFTAVNTPAKIEQVETQAELLSALQDPKKDYIQLKMNISSSEPIVFKEGEKLLDLNGCQLQYEGPEDTYALLTVEEGAKLTVFNGELVGTAAGAEGIQAMKKYAAETDGGHLILNQVKISGFDCALCTEDQGERDSVVQILNSQLEALQSAVYLKGNGELSEGLTKIYLSESTLISKNYIAVTGQGRSENAGTELIVSKCTIKGAYGGIYQPQKDSITKVSESHVTGNTGIAVKGGSLWIYDSEITGTGAIAADAPASAGSGYTDTGDAVYVEANYGWGATVKIEGENTIVKSEKAYAVDLFGVDEKGPGRVLLSGGTYQGEKGSAQWNELGTFEIYGGTFQGNVADTIVRYDLPQEKTEE